MKFSKEFREWFKKEFKSDIPDKWLSWWTFDMDILYNAFKAHNEELEQLREFKKKFQKLQNKLQQLDKKSYKDVQAEFKFNDVVEEIMYL